MRALIGVAGLCLIAGVADAQDWRSSPYNLNNSPYNFNNSPYNPNNSPYNFNNSPYSNQSNSVYDTSGNRRGYVVERPDGGANLFDNRGSRMGYVPGR